MTCRRQGLERTKPSSISSMATDLNDGTTNVLDFVVSSTMASKTDAPDWERQHWLAFVKFRKALIQVYKFAYLLVFVLGTFGNVMTVLMMFRLPAFSSGIFFQLLACSDQFLLAADALQIWLIITFGVPSILALGSWMCKGFQMVHYIMIVLSPWILVTLTIQRAASVLWPHRVNAVWTRRTSRVVAAVLVVVITLIYCHILYGWEKCGHREDCCILPAYRWFWRNVWYMVNNMLFSYLPCLILFLSNAALLWTVAGSVKTGLSYPAQQATQDSRQRKASSMTVTLVSVNLVFLLLNIPYGVKLALSAHSDTSNVVTLLNLRRFGHIAGFLWQINSGVNFYLYCITGRKLRAEVWKMALQFVNLFHRAQKKTQF